VPDWSFLTTHARVLLCIAHDPGARLRDIAATLGITERRAHGIITDLAEAGYVVKEKDGRRNRYQIQAHLPLAERGTREPAVGEVLAVLLGNTAGLASPAGGTDVMTTLAGGPGDREDDDGPGADGQGDDPRPGDDHRARAAGAM
jgi:predicted ArsR family transcriptional regulator